MYPSRINLVKYLEKLTAIFINAGADAGKAAIQFLKKSFDDDKQGRLPPATSIHRDLGSNKHHQEAFQILVLRHLETGMTMRDYYALCSLATQLD